jgi:DNA (cytosine-5)-methyltransferase 3A
LIKILLGGSPCTFWSIAQKNGRETEAEGMGWELFKNYLIAKDKFKPDFFLYENNKSAAQPIKDQISKELGVDLMYINSALVSAQNRQRFYAFNWEVEHPEDRGIVLRDILESGDDLTSNEKAYCLTARYGGACPWNTIERSQRTMVAEPIRIGDIGSTAQAHRVYSCEGKSVTLSANGGGQGGKTGLYATPLCHTIPQEVRVRKYTCDIKRFQDCLRSHKTMSCRVISETLGRPQTEVEHWFRTDKYFNIPDEDVWFDLKKLLNIKTTEFDNFVTVFEVREGVFEKADRCYDVNGKMSTLTTGKTDNIIIPTTGKEKPIYEVKDGFITIKDKKYPIKLADGYYIIRKLTPVECERLQTLPDGYTKAVSNTQRYKGLGNGWTAEVIIHILNGALKDVPRDEEIVVLSMYDGIGTGRYCLDKMGFTNVKYYAYEIDKYAKQIAMSNYPDIIQMGDAFDLRHPDWTIGY